MRQETIGWITGIVEDLQRQALVKRLERLSDHALDDVGLRRDQLDLMLLRPERARNKTFGVVRRQSVRPSLQGCG